MKENSTFGAKQIAFGAALLAICVVSQLFKNLSIFITGPIINACLVLAVMMINLPVAVILSIITPVTAFFITGSPVTAAVPLMVPFIMAGNMVLVFAVYFFMKKGMMESGIIQKWIAALVSSLLKGLFMGLTISLWLLPSFLPEGSPLRGKLPVLQTTFSLFQFLTAVIGFVYVFIILAAVRKSTKNDVKYF